MNALRKSLALIACCTLLGMFSPKASEAAINVAIVQGSFYTPNLKNNLTAAGLSVTEISSYTAASLTPYDAVIVYGNAYTDMTALTSYVTAGGTLVETPWFWLNNSPPSALQVVTNGGGAVYSQSSPGVNILNPSNSLLTGVSIPTAPGAFTEGRTLGNTFVAGTTQIANWADGTAFIGTKTLGAGNIVAINMHVITSDTAYQIINQPWATQLFVNAVSIDQVAAVPEPSSILLFGAGLAGLALGLRRRHVNLVSK